jgi:hypothetical protein
MFVPSAAETQIARRSLMLPLAWCRFGRGQRLPYQAICVPSGDHAGSVAVPQGETADFESAFTAPQPTATATASAAPSTAIERLRRFTAGEE